MINGKKVLAIIPARGGSKSIPRKNICQIAGKPLIAWTIEEAKKSEFIDRLILSSEDEEIIEVCKKLGLEVPFIRPIELAQDDTPGIDPVLHAIQSLPEKFDYVVLLQPTSPLRIVDDIDNSIKKCVETNANACVSVTEAEESPYWMYKLDKDERMKPMLSNDEIYSRRQDLPKVYLVNGAVYVADSEWIINHRNFITSETIAYRMPIDRSLDIDTELDLKICELTLNRRIEERS